MPSGCFRFENFSLDPVDRQLRCDAVPVELNARYFDALALLVREPGKLISKERFLAEVWHGLVVSDEALTQCIKTIRRQLGDSASRPRFIETVPKHGYRFIAGVTWSGAEPAAADAITAQITTPTAPLQSWQRFVQLGGIGTLGGAGAGLLGGLFYGVAGVSQSLQDAMGAISVLLVFLCLTLMIGLTGGAGVAFGIAAAHFAPGRTRHWSWLGGAIGGMVVGACAELLGLDAFNLLLGQSPGDITGALEGTLLGGAAGFGLWLGSLQGGYQPHRAIVATALAGALVGLLIPLLGGRLLGGSLDALTRSFPGSRFRLDELGVLFGETQFGLFSQIVTGALEGAVFCSCVAGAMLLMRQVRYE